MSDQNHIIALITDFGAGSIYVGELHAAIASTNPDLRVVDLCHTVQPQNIAEASFLLSQSYNILPSGSIIVTIVDPGVGTDRNILAVKTENYTFLAPDNGVLSHIIQKEKPLSIIQVENRKYFANRFYAPTFQGRWIFAPVAAHLAGGLDLTELGMECCDIHLLDLPAPEQEGQTIQGAVAFIDNFGNAVTNIELAMIKSKLSSGSSLRLEIGEHCITNLVDTYADAKDGEAVVLVDSFQCLEISCKNGNAATTLGLQTGDTFTLTWTDTK